MKIIICSNVYPLHFVGGAEIVAHNQAKALRNAGHDVIVFTGKIGINTRRYRCVRGKYDSLDVFRIHLSPADYQAKYWNIFHNRVEEHFSVLIDDFSPDIVHMHNLIGLSLGLIRLSKTSGAGGR